MNRKLKYREKRHHKLEESKIETQPHPILSYKYVVGIIYTFITWKQVREESSLYLFVSITYI